MSRPVKVTPELSAQASQLRDQGMSNSKVADALGISMATMKRLNSGSYRNAFLHRANNAAAPEKAAGNTSVAPAPQNPAKAVFDGLAKKLAPKSLELSEAVSPVSQPETQKEDAMLLQNEALSPEARQHFKLPRNPFVDDVQSPDDVFQTASVRYVRATLLDAAQHHGFVAIVGESGAGKTTLAEDLEERIKAEKRDILIVRPYVLAMESTDAKGKTLKASHIAEAIAYALDPQLKVKSSPQARFAQVHELLKASRRAGRRHLLVIEEAHCLPTATLKHLKRFLELKDGMQRLIGVALIGQPELRDRLSSQNAEVREVMQRCEVVELEPLSDDLEAYLRHKFARFDLKFEEVCAPDAADAIRARLVHIPRGGKPSDAQSQCFPLVVNNLVCRAMNAATRAGWHQVDAQVITRC